MNAAQRRVFRRRNERLFPNGTKVIIKGYYSRERTGVVSRRIDSFPRTLLILVDEVVKTSPPHPVWVPVQYLYRA